MNTNSSASSPRSPCPTNSNGVPTLAHFRSPVPCRYFQAGHCNRGVSCWFDHSQPTNSTSGKHADPPLAGPSFDTRPLAGPRAAAAQRDLEAAASDELEEYTCMICYDVPSNQLYGLLGEPF